MMKWYLFWLAVFVAGVCVVLYLPRKFHDAAFSAQPVLVDFDKERAWKDLNYQVDAGFRVPGTATHKKIQKWLVGELTDSAAKVETQPFSHRLGGKDVQMWNIIANYDGCGEAPRERVLLSAHWDSRPTADKDPILSNRKLPIPGANDGASGVAALLEIGRQLKAHPISRDVVIVLFDGEDYGPDIDDMLLGSQYYAAHLPKDKPAWGILLDMIGKTDLKIYREPNSDHYASAVNDRIFQAARELGYQGSATTSGFINEPSKYVIDDDHMPLNRAGVPVADIIDIEYPAWHTLDDTPAQCSADSLAMVGKTVLYALRLPREN